MLYDDSTAQTSLDFLLGITIFLLAFIFVFAFIPGMFAPFQSNSDEITMTADRVAATLVEVTLASDTAGAKLPGILNASKIDEFNAIMSNPVLCAQMMANLGLNGSGSELYDLEVIVDNQTGPSPLVISNGDRQGNANVGQSKRFVLVRDPDATGIDNYPGRMAILTVRVW